MALKDKQPPPDITPDAAIAAAIRDALTEEKLACADAFAVARALGVEPLAVGQTADLMEVRLARCQLGLFGYPGKHGWQAAGVETLDTPVGLEGAIGTACQPDGYLACAQAWRLAGDFGISRMQIGWVAERLGVKIAICQLGAF